MRADDMNSSPKSRWPRTAGMMVLALAVGAGGTWLALRPRQARVITPVNSVHRVVLMAVERGDLQNLIFDNQVLASHRAMAAVLGAILKMPPLKQAMASRQMKSRYLLRLLESLKLA